jgi:hypothetical protein
MTERAPRGSVVGAPGRALAAAAVLFASGLLASGCATAPPAPQSLDFYTRAETRIDERVSTTAVVLSPAETKYYFGVPLADKGIQPVWLQIDNQEDQPFVLMLLSLDPDYFAPSEVAWMTGARSDQALARETNAFFKRHVPVLIPAHSTVSGYVYTHLDPGAKAFSVELFGAHAVRSFDFVQLVPGFEADFSRIDFDRMYPETEVADLDLDELRAYLESLPCCVHGGDRKTSGDPLNLVFVGKGANVFAALVRQGWDLTETMRGETTWRTILSSIFGSAYRTSPVSPLYVFDRPQDIALQKARATVDERNHLRLWKAPVTASGQEVWVGQISRDIGVKLSSRTFVTHKIDPVVDEARLYITLDVANSQALCSVGYVKGVGESDAQSPRYNYTKDPYYTDGFRVVLVLGEDPCPLDEIEHLPWERVRPDAPTSP